MQSQSSAGQRSQTNEIVHDYCSEQTQKPSAPNRFYVLRHPRMRNDGKSMFIQLGHGGGKSMGIFWEGSFQALWTSCCLQLLALQCESAARRPQQRDHYAPFSSDSQMNYRQDSSISSRRAGVFKFHDSSDSQRRGERVSAEKSELDCVCARTRH